MSASTTACASGPVASMVMLQPGHEAEYEGRPPIFPIGCAGLITDYEQLPDGRYNIVLGGLVKFRVTSEDNSRPYRLARVETIPEVLDDRGTEALRQERERLTSLMSALYDQFGFPDPPPECRTNRSSTSSLSTCRWRRSHVSDCSSKRARSRAPAYS